MNRDTLYSGAVFDLDAGPVTITLPDAGGRFMSMQIFDEDEYTADVIYGPGAHTFNKTGIGTRYMMAAIRTLVDPNDQKDLAAVHALQGAITVSQRGGPGKFEVPNWDQASLKKVHAALLQLGETISDTRHMFGVAENQVDPVRHLVGTALVWGGLPEKDALYLPVTPARNDGATIHKLTVKDVPIDGFWSITVYNAEGYFEPNQFNAYSLNSITAKKGADGSAAHGCRRPVPGSTCRRSCDGGRSHPGSRWREAWRWRKASAPRPRCRCRSTTGFASLRRSSSCSQRRRSSSCS